MTETELSMRAESETDAHMKQAYAEMLAGFRAEPEQFLWHTEWKIMPRGSDKAIGGIGFKGAPENGTADIGYGVDEPEQRKGYAREALAAMCTWAFDHGAYVVTAEAETDNVASQHVLGACGFQKTGPGKEGERWELVKPSSSWLAIYMCLGMSIGCSVGVALGSANDHMSRGIGLGVCLGLAIGAGIGAYLDGQDKKKRPQPPKAEEPEKEATPDAPADETCAESAAEAENAPQDAAEVPAEAGSAAEAEDPPKA